jgi:hypothetical protein
VGEGKGGFTVTGDGVLGMREEEEEVEEKKKSKRLLDVLMRRQQYLPHVG